MLDSAQKKQFSEQGYLIVENVLDDKTRHALIDEYAALVDQLSHDRGIADDDWPALSLDERLTELLARDPDAYEWLDISLPMRAELDEAAGVHTGEAVFSLLTHPAILDIAESLLGRELFSNPVQHVRIKPPESRLDVKGQGNSNMARTGWHQDAAVVVERAAEVDMLTVWVAISDATPEMGCMRCVPGSHRWSGGLGQHCPGRGGLGEIFIPDALVHQHQTVDLAVKAGGVVLLHKNTWHGAGPNTSDRVRWSFDLRYQPLGSITGRECFPAFLARSSETPHAVLNDADHWAALWRQARSEIAQGKREAIFNERWEIYRNDPLCA